MEPVENPVADFPAESFAILAFCDACGHQALLDRRRLPTGLTVQQVRARLRCSACGSRDTSIRIVYTGAGGFHYRGESKAHDP